MTEAIKTHLRRRRFFDKEKKTTCLPSSPTPFTPYARTTHHGLHACEGALLDACRVSRSRQVHEGGGGKGAPLIFSFAASPLFPPRSASPPSSSMQTHDAPRTQQHRHRTALVATTIVVAHGVATPLGRLQSAPTLIPSPPQPTRTHRPPLQSAVPSLIITVIMSARRAPAAAAGDTA